MPTQQGTRRVWVETRQRKGRAKTFAVCYYDCKARRRRVERSFHSEALAEEFAFKFKRYLNKQGTYPILDDERNAVSVTLASQPEVSGKPKRDWDEQARRWVGMTSGTQNTRREKETKLKQFQEATRVHFVEDVTEDMVIDYTISLKQRHLGERTVAGHHRILLAFLNWARHRVISPETVALWKPYKMREKQDVHLYSAWAHCWLPYTRGTTITRTRNREY